MFMIGWCCLLGWALAPSFALAADPEQPKPDTKAAEEKPEAEDGADDEADEEKEEEKDKYFAVTGGVIHTVSHGDLYHHTILAKNGKIVEIAPRVDIPEEAEVLDATGHHIYPGLVAMKSGSVLSAEPPDATTNVYSLPMAIGLAGGITTAVTGNTAASLTFGSVDDMTIRSNLFHNLSYSTRDPRARQKLRADFERCRQYIRDLEAYRVEKKNNPDAKEPEKDWIKGNFKKYLSLLRGESTAMITANRRNEILAFCDFVNRFGINAAIVGATEGWTAASEMARAGISAVITPRRRMRPNEASNHPTGSSIENAAILHRHGVRIAIVPGNTSITLWGLAGRDLLQLNMEAAFAVRGGLSNDAALRAITLTPARMLGIDHRVGSIDVGKDANFAITDGDILHYMTHTRWAVVNGRVAYDKQKDTLYSHIRPDGDLDAPPPDDYWPRRLGE
jgi:hypothetical protein